jgi:epoxyqueuosine reductase QueG
MDSAQIRKMAAELGADLCGIGAADRFSEAPEGFHPRDVLPGCRSVIVLARRFNPSTLLARSTSPYTVTRNELSAAMNRLAVELAGALDAAGCCAVPVGSIGPDEYDEKAGKFRGTISLKHAAVLCGLGKMGKNTLLVNDRYGNMIWLSAVLTTAEMEPDPIAPYEPCVSGCTMCLKGCPVQALDGVSINQKPCMEHAFGAKNGGDWKIHCYICRKICPNHLGLGAALQSIQ